MICSGGWVATGSCFLTELVESLLLVAIFSVSRKPFPQLSVVCVVKIINDDIHCFCAW